MVAPPIARSPVPPDRVRLAARLAVAAVTALAFLPILQNGFVDFDDAEGLVVNTWIRGLGPANLRWMLTTFHLGHWQPLAWLSFALDYRLWGLDARGFHLSGLLLHAANAGLLAVLAERLLACADVPAGRRLAGAVTAALLWSVHPLRVESVAWATERRDVLSGFFFLATLLAYVPGPGRPPRIGWALAGTALTLASKASGMVLPALLVLLDVYPLRRVGGAGGGHGARAGRRRGGAPPPLPRARRGAGRVSDRALTDPRPRPERPAGGRRPLHVSRDDGVGRARRRSGRRHGGAPLARRAGGAPCRARARRAHLAAIYDLARRPHDVGTRGRRRPRQRLRPQEPR